MASARKGLRTEEILGLITRYRYMTREQVCRKLWKRTDRLGKNQLAKHFSKTITDALKEAGRLRENRDGVLWTTAKTAEAGGWKHAIAIVDRLLDVEDVAAERGYRFDFTYERVSEELRPDAAVLVVDGADRALLLFVEVDRGHEDLFDRGQYSLEEKFEKYVRAARITGGEAPAYEWWRQSRLSKGLPQIPLGRFGFRVLLFADRKMELPTTGGQRMFVQLPLEGGRLGEAFSESETSLSGERDVVEEGA